MSNNLSPVQAEGLTVVRDEELVARAQAGDTRGFEELVRRHGDKVYRVSRQFCHGNAADAEETYQNALLNAYRHLAGFRGAAQFSTWLVRIVINECLLYSRRYRKERDWVRLDEDRGENGNWPAELAEPSDDPEADYAAREFWAILDQCLAGLPKSYRRAFVLRHTEGLSDREIAERLGLSLAATKSQVLRARLRLRRCLAKKFCRGQRCYWPGVGIAFGAQTMQKEEAEVCSQSS